MDDAQLARAHYALLFPDLASLGAGAVTWRAEYDRVAATGLSATLAISSGDDGSSIGAVRNFAQSILLDALHTRRNALDPTYEAPWQQPPAQTFRRLGVAVRLGDCGL